ncbi:MAG: hypothetical protein HYZ00_07355 [Candidatus Hydrogenedentes bacterium]|nr:hypothetical protein [Candidatus Hydrogenedentota bacterium]
MNAAWRSHLAFLVLIAGVLWLACLTPGCASLKSDSGEHMRDGVRYGVTQGRFRGRWWNYYERGRSFLEGGYYAEAARDFRTALGNRSKDQLWPRIYGLHFIPEYFPQRELGVTRYYQQDLAGTEEALQASLSQQFSARAAYFLDQVRLKRIAAAGGDQVPPAVEFEALP